MADYRITSNNNDDLVQQLVLDGSWNLSLNGEQPLDKNGRPVSVVVEHGDQLTIGVDVGSGSLSSFSATLVDPAENRLTLDQAATTDGQVVTTTGTAGEQKTIKAKIVLENDLPDS